MSEGVPKMLVCSAHQLGMHYFMQFTSVIMLNGCINFSHLLMRSDNDRRADDRLLFQVAHTSDIPIALL